MDTNLKREQMSGNTWSLMLDLDSLFDTRYGVLKKIDNNKLKDLLVNDEYFNREYELFKDYDMDLFWRIYDNRDINILQNSIITKILPIIQSYLFMYNELLNKTPGLFTNTIIINTYPYNLNKKEMDMIANILYRLLGKQANIKYCHLDYKDIHPKWLINNVSIYISYEYRKWLEVHGKLKTFEKDVCPSVTIIGPRIIFGTLEEDLKPNEFFNLTETASKPICNLELIPIDFFCINIEYIKKED